MEFSRPGYWSEQPFPSPGDLPNPGIEPRPPALQADSLPAEPQGKNELYSNDRERAEVFGWPKSSFRSFHCVLWKNPKEIFGQPNTFKKRVTV